MTTPSTGSRHKLISLPEVTYGTIPATGTPQIRRLTGCTLGLKKNTYQSKELRADRQIPDLRHGTKWVEGDIPFELSYGTYDDFLESLLCGTWTANVLKAGIVRRSWGLQRQFTELTNTYLNFSGCEFDAFDLSVKPDAMIEGKFSIVGQNMITGSAAIGDVAASAASVTVPMDAFTGTISEGGSPIAVVTGLDLKVQNNLEKAFVVGTALGLEPSIGQSLVTGSVTAHFTDTTLLAKWITETNSTISVTLSDGTSSYAILLPRINYTGGDVPTDGPGQEFLTLPFTALYDASEATNIKITRTP